MACCGNSTTTNTCNPCGGARKGSGFLLSWVLQQQDAEPVAQSTMLPVAAVPNLQRLLEGLRQQAQVRALQQLKLNQLTYELTQLYMAVYSWAGAPCCLSLREFFVQRLGKWARKLQELPQLQPDVQDMEQLHRMRIRLKRFRYEPSYFLSHHEPVRTHSPAAHRTRLLPSFLPRARLLLYQV